MNLAKFFIWLLILLHFGAMALVPSVSSKSKSSEKEFPPNELVQGEYPAPVSLATKHIWIGLLDFLGEIEPETNIAFLSEIFFSTTVLVRQSEGCLSPARSIVPSLNTLTIIYPFHSFP